MDCMRGAEKELRMIKKKANKNTSILILWKRINQNKCHIFKYDDFDFFQVALNKIFLRQI